MSTPLIRAAQYIRMSTEHQAYSLDHQRLAIAAYAGRRAIDIVRTYADEGVSGLALENRAGLKALLADVLTGRADFELILTYDVSRWGRFQDPDQSAHYEFLCREAGVRIEYCAEPFTNDGSLTNSIVKQLKRAMAAEYSRELSVKVSAAQWNLARRGFWMGGPPGYGLRRRLVHADGSLGPILKSGEHKAITTDKVILVAGPARERAMVRHIFRLYVVGGMSRAKVARTLNEGKVRAEDGGLWSSSRILQILTNRKYLGQPWFGRTTGRLAESRWRPAEDWIRVPAHYRPIVSESMFAHAQRNLARRCRQLREADMIEGLRGLLQTHGRLTTHIINDAEHLPCSDIYRRRFGGSLLNAYAQAGFVPGVRATFSAGMVRKGQRCRRRNLPIRFSPEEMLERLRALLDRTGYLSRAIIEDDPSVPGVDVYTKVFGSLSATYARVGYQPTPKQLTAIAGWVRRKAPAGADTLARILGETLARSDIGGPPPAGPWTRALQPTAGPAIDPAAPSEPGTDPP
jgi:DNA invertase Pin-like site-specific DNA recombinase